MSEISISSSNIKRRLEYATVILAGLVLVFYSYAKLSIVPFLGFDINPTTGQVILVEAGEGSFASIKSGDRIIQVDQVTWVSYLKNIRQPLLDGQHPGETISILVEREGEQFWVQWTLPIPTTRDFLIRVPTLWLAYGFWAAGTASLLFLRPKDTRQRLLVAFNYLTALWLIAGSLSQSHLWQSAVVLRMAVWICLPVYWHLHWVFPKPLWAPHGRLPGIVVRMLYLIGFGLALAEWFQLLPIRSYVFGILLAASSFMLIGLHAYLQPNQRRDLNLLMLAVVLIALPTVALGIAILSSGSPDYGGGAVLMLPLLPGAYFYAVYRRQIGGLELRANRVIIKIIFIILIFTFSVSAVTLAQTWFPGPNTPIIVGVTSALTSSLITLFFFPGFQRWVERSILQMPLAPIGLLETYTTRIVTSLELDWLVRLLRDEVFPSLLIRQVALLRLEDGGIETKKPIPVLTMGIDPTQLPRAAQVNALATLAGQERSFLANNDIDSNCAWVKLILSLKVNEQLVGICLLGRRDPDDDYAFSEIPTLQALMDQTALALTNIEQAELLHRMYQINVERQETERRHLALELHDDILGQMAMLRLNVNKHQANSLFLTAYEAAVQRIRELIGGLYPGLLHYGLPAAFEELSDSLNAQVNDQLRVRFDLLNEETRYPPNIELHLYRIVQQACQNAIQHARAQQLCICGHLKSDEVYLEIQDDGAGFEIPDQLNLYSLLANRHFGLAGIYERAAFIGATVIIHSTPGQGTQVKVNWKANNTSTLL